MLLSIIEAGTSAYLHEGIACFMQCHKMMKSELSWPVLPLIRPQCRGERSSINMAMCAGALLYVLHQITLLIKPHKVSRLMQKCTIPKLKKHWLWHWFLFSNLKALIGFCCESESMWAHWSSPFSDEFCSIMGNSHSQQVNRVSYYYWNKPRQKKWIRSITLS